MSNSSVVLNLENEVTPNTIMCDNDIFKEGMGWHPFSGIPDCVAELKMWHRVRRRRKKKAINLKAN